MEEQIISTAPVQEMNWLARISNIFFEPRKVFESLKPRPRWLMPFVVFCLLSIAIGYIIYPIAIQDQIAKVEASDKYSDAQKEAMREGMEKATSGAMRFTVFLAPIGVAAQFLFVSLVVFLVFNVIMGGDSNLKTVLSVVSHSYMVVILGSLLQFPLVLLKGTTNIHTSLALVLPIDLKESFIYRLLNGLDIFSLWQVLVLSLGLSIIYNFGFKKSFVPVLLLWILLILVSALLSGVFAGLGGV